MSDGTLSIRRRVPKASEISQDDQARFDAPTLLHDINIGHGSQHHKPPTKSALDATELRVQSLTSKKLKEYDKFLKNFKYSAALDSVLKKVSIFDNS